MDIEETIIPLDNLVDESSIIETTIENIKCNYDLSKHPFFSNIKKGIYTPYKDISKIMHPFYFAVHNWSEHLLKFRKKLKYSPYKNLLTQNINDELGYGPDGIKNMENIHTITFIDFLVSLGPVCPLRINRPVEKFNQELNALLAESNAYHAFVLGGIEHFYVEISNVMCQVLDGYSIIQTHYKTHKILDEIHASDLFRIALYYDPPNNVIHDGIKKGYQLLWDLFLGLVVDYQIYHSSTNYVESCFEYIS